MADRLYVYGFVAAADAGRVAEVRAAGLDEAAIAVAGEGPILAVVSVAPAGRLRAQRRHMAAHQRVVGSVAAVCPALPASFGLVAGAGELAEMLESHEGSLLGELERVGDCVEYTVRVRWDGVDPFAKLVTLDGELAALRDEIARLGPAAPHDLKVAAGRRVERVLAAARREATELTESIVGAVAREISVDDPRAEAELVNLHALVQRGEGGAVDRAVLSLGERFDDTHAIDLTGPFAPHNFVSVRLSPELGEGVAA